MRRLAEIEARAQAMWAERESWYDAMGDDEAELPSTEMEQGWQLAQDVMFLLAELQEARAQEDLWHCTFEDKAKADAYSLRMEAELREAREALQGVLGICLRSHIPWEPAIERARDALSPPETPDSEAEEA